MNKCDVKQNALCKSLGPDYRILYIDLERCIYRDFGNGFDVEISGTHTTSNRKTATVYLWYVPEKITVKRVSGVKQSEIGKVVDELYQFSQELLRKGITDRDTLWEIRRMTSSCPRLRGVISLQLKKRKAVTAPYANSRRFQT